MAVPRTPSARPGSSRPRSRTPSRISSLSRCSCGLSTHERLGRCSRGASSCSRSSSTTRGCATTARSSSGISPEVAIVDFEFNAWGERSPDYAADGPVPAGIASHLGMRRYPAPFVLEGGSFFVDGEGTLLTTEQCLLNENRNPAMSREQIEAALCEYLGIETVLWLGEGHYDDFSTDGHIDDIAHFLAPGRVILHAPSNAEHPDHLKGLEESPPARERPGRARPVDRGRPLRHRRARRHPVPEPLRVQRRARRTAGRNHDDDGAVEQNRAVYPDRELAIGPRRAVPSGGGGPTASPSRSPRATGVARLAPCAGRRS